MPTLDAAIPHDLIDEQCALLAPLLPKQALRRGPRRWPLCGLIDGVRYRFWVGRPWRDVPAQYGPWWRVHVLFSCLQLPGIWTRVEEALLATADAAGKVDWQVSVNATTARAHLHAAGARQDGSTRITDEPADHALGRSRGG